MTDIRFYHMVQKKLEAALPEIVAKAHSRGHRVLVKTASPARAAAIDTLLWSFDAESFIPHSATPGDHAAAQPVFITDGDDNPNKAGVLILTDGATMADVSGFEMCCELFDEADRSGVEAARERWKAYKAQGHAMSYFQQDDDGRWVQKQ